MIYPDGLLVLQLVNNKWATMLLLRNQGLIWLFDEASPIFYAKGGYTTGESIRVCMR